MIERLKFRGKAAERLLLPHATKGEIAVGLWSWMIADNPDGCMRFFQFVACGMIDTASVGQWTGLKDKNGKEIYEGDIVRCREDDDVDEGTVHVVTYCGDWGYPAFELDPCPIDDSNGLSHYSVVGSVEVIGNIHEEAEGE